MGWAWVEEPGRCGQETEGLVWVWWRGAETWLASERKELDWTGGRRQLAW